MYIWAVPDKRERECGLALVLRSALSRQARLEYLGIPGSEFGKWQCPRRVSCRLATKADTGGCKVTRSSHPGIANAKHFGCSRFCKRWTTEIGRSVDPVLHFAFHITAGPLLRTRTCFGLCRATKPNKHNESHSHPMAGQLPNVLQQSDTCRESSQIMLTTCRCKGIVHHTLRELYGDCFARYSDKEFLAA